MQLRLRTTKSTQSELFKKINGRLGQREICIVSYKWNKHYYIFTACLVLFTNHPFIRWCSFTFCYTRRLLYICHGIFLWSIFKILSYENCINESKLLLLMLNRTKQSYAFGSFKLLLRIINRYQPTERTDCELLQKSLLDKLKKRKKKL